MKKLVLLITFIVWMLLPLAAGVKAVFPYNYPSKKTLMNLVMENSAKGKAYGDYLLYAVNLGLADTTLTISRENISTLFNNLFSEEFILEEGKYMNSGYDSIFQKMVPSLGHKWQGFVWTFKIGTYAIRLIKADCGNVLITKVIRKKIVPIIILEKKIEKVQPKEELVEKSYQYYYLPRQEKEVVLPSITPRVRKVNPTFIIAGITFTIAGVGYLVYSLLNKECRREINTPTNGDNNRWRSNPGQGQDPPPNSGEDTGGPVDPPPSGN